MSKHKNPGQPTKFKPEYIKQAYKLSLLHSTDKEMADFFEVSESTFYLWKTKEPEFSEALKRGKEIADAQVANSLYKRAMGFKCKDTDIRVIDGKIVQTPIIKHYPPDPVSAIFWLKNRQPDKWMDTQKVEVSGSVKSYKIVSASTRGADDSGQ